MNNESFEKWKEFYLLSGQNGKELLWPCENLIRLFKGKYISDFERSFENKKLLEVGFGSGNNLNFFNTLGLKLFGTEVSQDICDNYSKKLASLSISAILREGTNTSIPLEDNYFDYLVSWNVIHYENSEENMIKAIKEYSRVLKPGGRFFISTTGPENSILRNSIKISNHLYRITRNDTFREGEIYFYFDDESSINNYFSINFTDIKIGRTKTDLFSECLDWFIITGINRG
jgi:ubiquinone/menaquinone biosynthesis C-methylase UbiE